jgi:uncharacterized protein (DUF2249 family)
MSDYRIEFGSIIGPNDTDRLYQLLSVVAEGDELEITMSDDDPTQVNAIIDTLESNEFNVSNKGGHGPDKYHIIARRKQ